MNKDRCPFYHNCGLRCGGIDGHGIRQDGRESHLNPDGHQCPRHYNYSIFIRKWRNDGDIVGAGEAWQKLGISNIDRVVYQMLVHSKLASIYHQVYVKIQHIAYKLLRTIKAGRSWKV